MTVPDPNAKANDESGFLSSHQTTEPRSWMPWIVSGAIVVAALVLLMVLGRQSKTALPPGGTGMAAAAPYAANLPVSEVEMSQAASFSGAKVTYIDGKIANTGTQVIHGITVEVGFRNEVGQLARMVTPLSFIRTRQPYIDTEPVSAAPLKPGDVQAFRLIFDSIPLDWNQQLPQIRIIAIQNK